MTSLQPEPLTSLTREQQSKIPAFRQEWLDIGLSCEPANREAAVDAVNEAYRQAGLEPPEVVIWMDSPFAGAVAAWMASEIGPALENFDLVKVFRDKMTAAFDRSVDSLAPPTMYAMNRNLSLWHDDVQPWDSYAIVKAEIADRFNGFVRDEFDRLWQGLARSSVHTRGMVHPSLVHTVFNHFPLALSLPIGAIREPLRAQSEGFQSEDLVNRTWQQLQAQLIPQLRTSIAGPETASPLIPIRTSSLINQSIYADRLFVTTSDKGLVPWEMISTRQSLREAVGDVGDYAASRISQAMRLRTVPHTGHAPEIVRGQLWPRPPYISGFREMLRSILPELVGQPVHFDVRPPAQVSGYLRHMSRRWHSVAMPDIVFLPTPIAVFDTIYSDLFAPVRSTLLDHRATRLDGNLLMLGVSSLFDDWTTQVSLVRRGVSDGIGSVRPVARAIESRPKRWRIDDKLDILGFCRLLNSAGEFSSSVTEILWKVLSEVLRMGEVALSNVRNISELIGSTTIPRIRATSAIQVDWSPQVAWGVWNNTSPVFERDRWLNQIPGALLGAIDQAIRQSQLIDQTKEYVADVAMELILDHVAEHLNVQIKNGTAVSKIQRHVDHVIWGQHDYWLSFYDFFARVCGVESCKSLSGLINVAKNAGWWWPFEGAVIITDRPTATYRDANNRLHNETRPAIEYRDGEGVFSWHGVRVPRALIEGKWTADDILKEPNAEIRRCAIEKMGWDWFVHSAGLEPVGKPFRDPGNQGCWLTLYDVPRQLFQAPIRVLLCDNATLERDGTRRRFGLTVPADCRDPLTAAGWTFGLTREQYAKLRHAY